MLNENIMDFILNLTIVVSKVFHFTFISEIAHSVFDASFSILLKDQSTSIVNMTSDDQFVSNSTQYINVDVDEISSGPEKKNKFIYNYKICKNVRYHSYCRKNRLLITVLLALLLLACIAAGATTAGITLSKKSAEVSSNSDSMSTTTATQITSKLRLHPNILFEYMLCF
jgi:hypothetical protein